VDVPADVSQFVRTQCQWTVFKFRFKFIPVDRSFPQLLKDLPYTWATDDSVGTICVVCNRVSFISVCLVNLNNIMTN